MLASALTTKYSSGWWNIIPGIWTSKNMNLLIISEGITMVKTVFLCSYGTISSRILMPEITQNIIIWHSNLCVKCGKLYHTSKKVRKEKSQHSMIHSIFDFIPHCNVALTSATCESNISIKRSSCVAANEKTERHTPALTHKGNIYLIASVSFAIHPSSWVFIWLI